MVSMHRHINKIRSETWLSQLAGDHSCESIQQQHLFNSPLSGTTWVSRYQKDKTNLDSLKQEIVSDSGISWAICISAPCSQTDNHASTSPLSFLQAGCHFCHTTASKHWEKLYSIHEINKNSKHYLLVSFKELILGWISWAAMTVRC